MEQKSLFGGSGQVDGEGMTKDEGAGEPAEERDYEARTFSGYMLDQVVSALQKEIRRAHVYESVYWARELIRSGFWKYLWRRLFIIASEDIGLADDMAILTVQTLYQNFLAVAQKKTLTREEADRISLIAIHATMRLARAAKNREVADANLVAEGRWKDRERLEIPDYAIDMHTKEGRKRGYSGKKGREFFRKAGGLVEPKAIIDGNRFEKEALTVFYKLNGDGHDVELPEDEEQGQ